MDDPDAGGRRLHVVVIGAGIVGTCTALELLRDGCAVTLLDPGPPGGAQAASFGNGGWLSPASVVPMALPGQWRQVPGWLRDPLGPLAIRPRHLPRLLPWLVRFLRAGESRPGLAATARALRTLLHDCPERHRALAAEAGVPALIRRDGLLYAFPDRAAFAAEAFAWSLRAGVGVRWAELEGPALRQLDPGLDRRYGFGVFLAEGGHCTDPGAYVAALAEHARAQGAAIVAGRATGFAITAGRLRAVRTDAGDIAADRAVICAGAWSRALAAMAGDRVSLESERGYHTMLAVPADTLPRIPLMAADAKMAVTPMRGGVRLAGQVELAGLRAPPDWRRAAVLRGLGQRIRPALAAAAPSPGARDWMGHRPSTPDGLPVIGPARLSPDIIHAFGHGHVGLAAGPATGRLVADLIAGHAGAIDPAPFAARRFRPG